MIVTSISSTSNVVCGVERQSAVSLYSAGLGHSEVRYAVEAVVGGDCLRAIVELPDEPADVVVITVFVVE